MKPYTFEEIDQINDVIRGIIAESSGEYDWVRPWVAKKHPDFSSDQIERMAAAIIRKREAAKSSTKAPDTGAQDVGHDDNPGTGSNDLTRNVEKFIQMFGTKDNLAKDMKYWSAKVEDYVDRRNPYGKGASYADSMCEKAARRYHDFMEHDMNPIQRKLVADLQRIAGESGLDSKDMDHITYYKTKVDGHTYLILTNADRSGNIIIRDDGTIEDQFKKVFSSKDEASSAWNSFRGI